MTAQIWNEYFKKRAFLACRKYDFTSYFIYMHFWVSYVTFCKSHKLNRLISRKSYVFLLHKKSFSHFKRGFSYDSFASWRFFLSNRGLKVQKIGRRHSFFRPYTVSIYCLRLGNLVKNIGNLFHATNVCFIIYSFCKSLWWLDLFVL